MSCLLKNCYSEKTIKGIKTRLFKKGENGEVVFSEELNNLFYYSDEEFEQIFNGKNKLWLRKEMSRWRKNVHNEKTTMKGTLNNLEMLCFIANCEPNDILLDGVASKKITANTQYLSLNAINGICKSLVATYEELNEEVFGDDDYFGVNSNQNKFLEKPLLLPIEFSPTSLRFLFLKIYKDFDNDIKMVFVVNEYNSFSEGFVPTEYEREIFNLTSTKNNIKSTLEEFYHVGLELLSNKYESDLYTDYILDYFDDSMKCILTKNENDDFFFELYGDKLKYPEDYIKF